MWVVVCNLSLQELVCQLQLQVLFGQNAKHWHGSTKPHKKHQAPQKLVLETHQQGSAALQITLLHVSSPLCQVGSTVQPLQLPPVPAQLQTKLRSEH